MATSDEAWAARCDLAACFRLVHLFGMTDLIYTHLSARVPGAPTRYLLAPYGMTFDEVTASDLIEADLSERARPDVDDVALHIHGQLYAARPKLGCALHVHSVAGVAVSAMERGLMPISQHALMVLGELAYHDYQGLAQPDEMAQMAAVTEGRPALILRNHGLLTLGSTVARAFKRLYFLEMACRIQVAACAAPGGAREIAAGPREETIREFLSNRQKPDWADLEWAAMLRRLEREGSDHAR